MSVPFTLTPGPREGDRPEPGSAEVDGVRLGVPVTVRTPATSANLGPGFDSLGLALALYDQIEVVALPATASARPVEVHVEGEGAGVVPCDEHHLVVRAIRAGLEHAGAGRPALVLRCRNVIPHGRGLGSSASAVVAGLVAARGLVAGPAPLDDATLLRLATAFEGHPDNAAAALLGGFTVSWTESGPGPLDGEPTRAAQPFQADPGGTALPHPVPATVAGAPGGDARVLKGDAGVLKGDAGAPGRDAGLPDARAITVPVHPDVRVVACVPERELATSVARKMLPAEVPHADAAFNAGRTALLVEALSRRPHLLLPATADRLHQCQRATAMPDSARLVRALRSAGVAAVISGAGPTVLALGTGDGLQAQVAEVLDRLVGGHDGGTHEGTHEGGPAAPRWQTLLLTIDTIGATVVTESVDR